MSDMKLKMGRRDFFRLAGGGIGIAALSYFLGVRDRVGPAPSDSLPDYYDDLSGFPTFRAPYLQKDLSLAAFMFLADLPALTALCEQTLNASDFLPYRYIPVTPNALLVYADMLVSSLDARDSQIGQIPETEVSFWVLTLAMQKTATGFVPHHLAWHIPYLFVDESNSLSTGREVYGFNKRAASFTKPVNIEDPPFSAHVLGLEKFGPASIAKNESLLRLESTASESVAARWTDVNSARTAVSEAIAGNIRADWEDDLVKFATAALTEDIPLIFLKQFRHASDPHKACYRSIVEAPLRVKKFYEGGSFRRRHVLKISDLHSHPIKRNLGMLNSQEATFSAWMKLDMILEKGTEYV